MTDNFAAVLPLEKVARVPAPGDNAAIAIHTLPGGARILLRHLVFEVSHTVLEGHRFAVQRIEKGQPLLSWGLPFGLTLRPIEPGEYLCNERILRVLDERRVDFPRPVAPNFSNFALPFKLNEANFQPADQVAPHQEKRFFRGFRRCEKRGAGTRNHILLLGTNSRTAAFVRELALRFKGIAGQFANIDGVVPVGHTEGGGSDRPHNFELTLRTLAGFMVNANVAAVLAVDSGGAVLSNTALKDYLEQHDYQAPDVLHEFFTVTGNYKSSLAEAERIVRGWLADVNKIQREDVSVEHLKLGLQCGGSDAFSGISGNPLVGMLSRETVAYGGSANLAETDELIGAESYVLEKVRDLATAKAFLEKLERFQNWAAWHGHSAEGNPSGGNLYRGLYNISIKSIGAARKKDPATRLDYVIDFADRMSAPGFYFMDSPGNDLESIAGQVAAGCNMILFATGNGSITNFPFVPTIKIMTTTSRFELVRNEMDFNAGRYLEGEPLETLGAEAFELLLRIASGERSAGERAGHSQVQLWREWRQDGKSPPPQKPAISGKPVRLALENRYTALDSNLEAKLFSQKDESDQIALILPTSLCSGQIASMVADRLNERIASGEFQSRRAVALPHTEGCGNSAGDSETLFMRTMAGYLAHPLVSKALLLEHGCEKTHNDAFRSILRDMRIPESQYGWASVQLDGGIERVIRKVLKWFEARGSEPHVDQPIGVAFIGSQIPDHMRQTLELLGDSVLRHGGAVIIPHESELWPDVDRLPVSLDYGQRYTSAGLHTMFCPTPDAAEIVTGVGSTGVRWIIGYRDDALLLGNPIVPTLQLTSRENNDADLFVSPELNPAAIANNILGLISEIQQEKKAPRSRELKNIAFQITRGYTGISL
jgi:altronate dehydratase